MTVRGNLSKGFSDWGWGDSAPFTLACQALPRTDAFPPSPSGHPVPRCLSLCSGARPWWSLQLGCKAIRVGSS